MIIGWEPKATDRAHAERRLVKTCMDIADNIKAPALLQQGGIKRRIWEAVQELDYWKARERKGGEDGQGSVDADAGEPDGTRRPDALDGARDGAPADAA